MIKVILRNQSSPNDSQSPREIFDILKQHFGELAYSAMPMADFYNTRPLPEENAMEYWIRLNKAIDTADECLKRQGRSVECPGHEVLMMFIKYCPDPVLANRLSFKAAEEWTTSEVQERINAFQRECRANHRESSSQIRLVPSYVQSGVAPEHFQRQPEPMNTNAQRNPIPQYSAPIQVPPQIPVSVVTESFQQSQRSPVTQVTGPTVPLAPPQLVSATFQPPGAIRSVVHSPEVASSQPADFGGVHSLMQLLDCLATHYKAGTASQAHPVGVDHASRPCKVCHDPTHSTLWHCRRNNLCLACFSPGHWKKNCPNRGQRPAQNPTSDTVNQSQPSGN